LFIIACHHYHPTTIANRNTNTSAAINITIVTSTGPLQISSKKKKRNEEGKEQFCEANKVEVFAKLLTITSPPGKTSQTKKKVH